MMGQVMPPRRAASLNFFFNDAPTTALYTLSLHDALPILVARAVFADRDVAQAGHAAGIDVTEAAATSIPEIGRAHVELQSPVHLVCRLLLEKKKKVQGPAAYAPRQFEY